MKITKQTHPVLEVLKSGEFLEYKGISPSDLEAQSSLHPIFEDLLPKLTPVYVFSEMMCKTAHDARDKLLEKRDWFDVAPFTGTLIVDGGSTICVEVGMQENNGKNHEVLKVFIFAKSGKLTMFNSSIPINDGAERQSGMFVSDIMYEAFLTQNPTLKGRDKEELIEDLCGGALQYIFVHLCFLKYANTTDKFIKANSTKKVFSKSFTKTDKYINKTDIDIRYITSTYITNLYVAGEFGVKGHWRFQPMKKNGVWTKELIWINEFKKHGYTRKAEILTAQAS